MGNGECRYCGSDAVFFIECETYVCDDSECLSQVVHEYLDVEEI